MDNNSEKVSIFEKISMKLSKEFLVNRTKTFLIIAILIVGYISINLWLETVELPKYDVTENKIYTLTDSSKKAIEKVTADTHIYVYGVDENAFLMDLLKQYNTSNNKITYEIITEENNYDLVTKYSCSDGYPQLIIKSGDSVKKILNDDFYTYDYESGKNIDTSEQVITNSILALTEENKPKIYFVEGHNEYTIRKDSTNIQTNTGSELGYLTTFLGNEAFEIDVININTVEKIPDDCDILAIMSPQNDFFENEVNIVKEYINRGGEIFFSSDIISENVSRPNIQNILNEYGVSVENGYVVENEADKFVSNYPYIFMPKLSSENKITADIYTDGNMILMYSPRLKFLSDNELNNLNIQKEILVSSSDKAIFVNDFSVPLEESISKKQPEKSDIAACITKTIEIPVEGNETANYVDSKLVIIAVGNFETDYASPFGSTELILVYNNKDFIINAMSYLGNKGNILTIRKDRASSTYAPNVIENRIVLSVIFMVPIVIILTGIVVWAYRKKRK